MAGPPPISVQQRVLKSVLCNQQLSFDQWEYAVSQKWLEYWENAVSSESQKTLSATSQCRLETSFSLRQQIGPVTMATDDAGNEYIKAKWWKLLVSWYGLDVSHQARRRLTCASYFPLTSNVKYSSDVETVLCDRQLDFLDVSVCYLKDIDDADENKSLLVFAWDCLEYIEYQVRRFLQVTIETKVCLWFCLQENGQDIAFTPVAMTPDINHLLGKICVLQPSLIEMLKERQSHRSPSDGRTPDSKKLKQPLSQVLREQGLNLVIAVEEMGMSLTSASASSVGEWTAFAKELDGAFESIMTVSTIQNRWEEILTECLDKFTREVGDIAFEKRNQLLASARVLVAGKIQEAENVRTELETKMKAVEDRERTLSKWEQELDENQHDFNSKMVNFKAGLADFLTQRQKLEVELQKIEKQNQFAESKVTLDIGGHHFTTSAVTLNREPDSMLALMFSGRHVVRQEADGSYFIDRDGTNFRYILNYLRDGPKSLEGLPDSPKLISELIAEAEFYQMSQLAAILQDRLSHLMAVSMSSVPYQQSV